MNKLKNERGTEKEKSEHKPYTIPLFHSLLIRDSVITLHFRNLLLQLPHLFLLQYFLVLDGDYLDKFVYIAIPVVEHRACQIGACVEIVLADKLVQFLAVRSLFDE